MLILCLEKILSIGLLPIHGLLAIHGLFIINHFLTDELKNICFSTLYMFYNTYNLIHLSYDRKRISLGHYLDSFLYVT
ncbi:hypothetical protein COM55_18160 [Bacillus pseudomycoides]|nr:hypothetical protein COM55_18160 [Bacillus pseudomycoides]